MWVVFAIASAVTTSLNSILEKRALRQVTSMELTAGVAWLSLLLTLPLLFFVPFDNVTVGSLVIIFFGTLLGATSFLFAAKGLRHLDISLFDPLLNLGPAVTAVIALAVLGESLTGFEILGLGLTVAGTYILESHRHQRILDPVRRLLASKYSHFVFLVLIIHSLTSLVDRASLSNFGYPPLTYIFFIHLFFSFHVLIFSLIFGRGINECRRFVRHAGWLALPIVLLTVLTRTFYAYAASSAAIGIVSALKRTASLFSTLIGGELFHEKHLLRKTIACAVTVGGALLIILM